MNKNEYIGIDLARHLHEKGFNGESEYFINGLTKEFWHFKDLKELEPEKKVKCPVYSYYQILTSLAKELFGLRITIKIVTEHILFMLQQNKPQEEIDFYIKSNLIDKWK